MERKEYLEERKRLYDKEWESYRDFDKTLITVSSGAIALSVTFVANFTLPVLQIFIFVSWVFWLLTIVMEIFSFQVSATALRRESEILAAQYRDLLSENEENKFIGYAGKLNFLAFASFMTGAYFFLAFIILNFQYFAK